MHTYQLAKIYAKLTHKAFTRYDDRLENSYALCILLSMYIVSLLKSTRLHSSLVKYMLNVMEMSGSFKWSLKIERNM